MRFEASPAAATAHEQIVALAIDAVKQPGDYYRDVLDRLPSPVYITDADGRITYYNPACAAFSGRTPVVGRDSWCVTWKLYTRDGAFLPHDQCPMAVAIREKRPVRGVEAVAERPDGSRVSFIPYPTPLLNDAGELVGAVNLLVDVNDRKQAEYLRAQAVRCRRLARSVNDAQTVNTLTAMAVEYEEKACGLDQLN